MSLCINSNCPKPQNPDNILFCQACGSEVLLQQRYRVQCQLGRGGFGVTYEINEVRTNQAKVLKVLINNDPKAVELFKQEADVLSQLHHSGIPNVELDAYFEYYPYNSQNPIHCLVMEKVVGEDLEKYMRKRGLRPINQTTAIEWLKDIIIILEQVHNKNFFHRDIKPPNIMLRSESAELVLIDFGTVRKVTSTVFKQQGGVTGIISAGYTPSEQINNNAVPQSDFFALGRTFVYLLTGKEPLDPIMYDSYNETLNWRNHAPQISSMLADLLDDMMQRLYKDRPQNSHEILQRIAAIEKALQSPKPQPPIPQPPIPSNNLKTFSFEVVTTDARGNITNRRKESAKYFTEDLGNGVTLEMVEIPGGTFIMGSPTSEENRSSSESPQHQVRVPSFYMGKYELTQAQYQAIIGTNPSNFKGDNRPVERVSWNDAVEFCKKLSQKTGKNLGTNPSSFKRDNRPVERVGWNDAVAFCEKLSQKTGKKYRLPSEAEWEYACRAGTTTPFYFGESITPDLVNYDGDYTYASAPKGKYRQHTTDVGTFPPNSFGLYDMHGNVWEWCQDDYDNYINAPTDGSALTSPRVSYKLLRGGSWGGNHYICRSAYRGYNNLDSLNPLIGFRVVCSGAART
jgi:formylglycine-generating enzyme required for sulfatase activity